jgi:hypothetical protein
VSTCSDLLADLTKERERITRAIIDLPTSRAALDEVIAAVPADVTERTRSGEQPASHRHDRHQSGIALPRQQTS